MVYLDRIRKDSCYKSIRTIVLIASRFLLIPGALIFLSGVLWYLALFFKDIKYLFFVLGLLLVCIALWIAPRKRKSGSGVILCIVTGLPGSLLCVFSFESLESIELIKPLGPIFFGGILMFFGWLLEELWSVIIDIADSVIDLNHRYDNQPSV